MEKVDDGTRMGLSADAAIIEATDARVTRISEVAQSEWNHRGSYLSYDAMIIQFTNRAAQLEPRVQASLTYKDKESQVLQIVGAWINPPSDVVEFRRGQSHSLIVGFLLNGDLVPIEGDGSPTEGGENSLLRQRPLSDFQQGTVLVRLVDVDTKQSHYEGLFEIGKNPSRIFQRSAGHET